MAMMIIGNEETVLVHGLHVDIDLETQNPITFVLLDVGLRRHQVTIGNRHHVGDLTTMLSNVRGRGTDVDGRPAREEMNPVGGHGGGATEVTILHMPS